MMFNLIAVSCRTFSLGHTLIGYVFDFDRDGGDEDSHCNVRRVAKSDGYCATKTTPPIKTCASLCAEGAPAPTKASDASLMKANQS